MLREAIGSGQNCGNEGIKGPQTYLGVRVKAGAPIAQNVTPRTVCICVEIHIRYTLSGDFPATPTKCAGPVFCFLFFLRRKGENKA